MTAEELELLLAKPTEEVVKGLKRSSFNKVPKWSALEPQYDPLQHSIMQTSKYPAILNENGKDTLKRTPLALQKLLVDRVSQMMFSDPVSRVYTYARDSEKAKKAADIVEQLYSVENSIAAENLERGKQNNASCEILTVWFTYEEENFVAGESTKFRLSHKTYSAKESYELYVQQDSLGRLVVATIAYKDAAGKEHLDVYTQKEYRRYDKEEEWALNKDASNPAISVPMPVAHTWLGEPVWGGEAGTILVEQVEEMESYDGLYIVENAAPVFTQDMGDTSGMQELKKILAKAKDVRRIILTGKGGSMKDVSWKGAVEATANRIKRLRNSLFEQAQTPDNSFATMINSNTSADNKDLVLTDAKAKALDLGGEWEKLFYAELKIVLKFAAIMFPSYRQEFEKMSIRSKINPYSVKTKKEAGDFVSTAGGSMSLDTQVRELGTVDDVDGEVERIKEEQNASNNL